MAGKPYDATMKDLIEASPLAWAERYCHRAVSEATVIDADVSTVTAAADKVIRARQDVGECLVHIEAETGHAGEAPGQLLLYSTLLEARHGLPVRSVLLLLRPGANATAATGLLERRHAAGEPPYKTFRYEVVRVWELTAESLLTGPLAFVPLAPLTNDAVADPVGVAVQAVRRFRSEATERVGTMETSLLVLAGLRHGDEVIDRIAREVQEMEESAGYQWILRKGETKGAARELKQTVLRMGRRRFGEPPAPASEAVEAITDLDRLRALTDRILDAASWDDLLATP